MLEEEYNSGKGSDEWKAACERATENMEQDEYRYYLENRSGEKFLAFLSEEGGKSERILKELDIDFSLICDGIEFKRKESFHQFYHILFENRCNDWKTLCERLLYGNKMFCGVSALYDIWKYMSAETPESQIELEEIMKNLLREYLYGRHREYGLAFKDEEAVLPDKRERKKAKKFLEELEKSTEKRKEQRLFPENEMAVFQRLKDIFPVNRRKKNKKEKYGGTEDNTKI